MKNNWFSLRAELEKLGKYCDKQNGCSKCDFFNKSMGCYFGCYAPFEWIDKWEDNWNEDKAR